MITTALFDLDGVVRHFERDGGLEARHGLAEGAIDRVAFASPLLDDVTTGRITRAHWIARVAEETSPAAAEEWGHTPFRIDEEMVSLVDALRARGIRCAILTNGTDTISAELTACGLDRSFDQVFNSAEIGLAKPDPRVFRHVVDVLGVAPEEVFFTDDSPSKIIGAVEIGMVAHVFTGIRPLRAALRGAGVLDDRSDPV